MRTIFKYKLTNCRTLSIIFLLGLSFFTVSCDKDDDPIDRMGAITLVASQSNYEGPRGTDVLVSVNVTAADGIASIVVTPDGQAGETLTPHVLGFCCERQKCNKDGSSSAKIEKSIFFIASK